MTRILFITADPKERERALKRWRDLNIHVVQSVREAVAWARDHQPELTCIDLTTLDSQPKTLLTRLRRVAPGQAFVLILGGDDHKPAELDVDAYLRKPFNKRMFRSRVNAALRARNADIVEVGEFRLDTRTRTLHTPHGSVHLRPREQTLLLELMRRAGEVVPREDLVHVLWHTSYPDDTRALDVHMSWLRRKLEPNPRKPQYLRTVYGVGYQFLPQEEKEEEDDE
ncbi:MAG: response regulator transcription factor [Chloroflexi bacterium]|nr:response regulator transcription factor [Chloroflexota bacterium]